MITMEFIGKRFRIAMGLKGQISVPASLSA